MNNVTNKKNKKKRLTVLLLLILSFLFPNITHAQEVENVEYSFRLGEESGEKGISIEELWKRYQINNLEKEERDLEYEIYENQVIWLEKKNSIFLENIEELKKEMDKASTPEDKEKWQGLINENFVKKLENEYQIDLTNAFLTTKEKNRKESITKTKQNFINEIIQIIKLEAQRKNQEAKATYLRLNQKIKQKQYKKDQIRYVEYQKAIQETDYEEMEIEVIEVLLSKSKNAILRETGKVGEVIVTFDLNKLQAENIRMRMQAERNTTSWQEDFNIEIIRAKKNLIQQYRDSGLNMEAERETLLKSEIKKLELENRRNKKVREKNLTDQEVITYKILQKYQKSADYAGSYYNFLLEKYRLYKENLVTQLQIREWEKEYQNLEYIRDINFSELFKMVSF